MISIIYSIQNMFNFYNDPQNTANQSADFICQSDIDIMKPIIFHGWHES